MFINYEETNRFFINIITLLEKFGHVCYLLIYFFKVIFMSSVVFFIIFAVGSITDVRFSAVRSVSQLTAILSIPTSAIA